jgi:hypothetical protein
MKTVLLSLAISVGLATASCGGAEEAKNPSDALPKVGAPKVDPANAAKNTEADKQKQAKALEDLTQGEVKGGECDADHKASMEKLMASVEDAMKAKAGDDGKPIGFTVVDKRTAVFGPDPRNVQIKVTGRGTEVHIMAFGSLPTSLDMMHEGRAATVRSPAATELASKSSIEHPKFGKVTEAHVDSRIVDVKAGETLEIKVRGQGCGVLIAFMKP